jgi:glycosyltransferase involved in cell wall biosynthesis
MLNPVRENDVKQWKPYNKRQHFITIGNFLHEPNWNAVQYLKEEIWPLIRKELPKTELHIYGAYASEKVEQLQNIKQGFVVKGRAESAKEVVGKARVLLAPIRFGAGLKGKLIEAMQCGTPSVTTTVGAEAMSGSLSWPGAIEDDPELFAKAAVRIYEDPDDWKVARDQGPEIINRLYSKEQLGSRLKNRLESLFDNLQIHRQQNFIGTILHHHTAASTRYMSKWIEAKNA